MRVSWQLGAACALLAIGCGRPAPAPSPSGTVAVTSASAASDAAVPVERRARWDRASDDGGDGGATWVRREGPRAPPLVVRGTVVPESVDDNDWRGAMQGARHGAPDVALSIEGAPRSIFVFARARGPIGIAANQQWAVAHSNAWARLELDGVSSDLVIRIADVDQPGERRGQTSPFVLVVADEDAEPTEEPAPRAALGPNDVTVRWALTPTPCSMGLESWTCARATIELGGAEKRRIPLKYPLRGQSGCWPSGVGVRCSGASGFSDLSLSQAADGTVQGSEYAASDGYCPPPEDCGALVVWTTFKLRKGLHLVPDPAGTFPPDERDAGE